MIREVVQICENLSFLGDMVGKPWLNRGPTTVDSEPLSNALHKSIGNIVKVDLQLVKTLNGKLKSRLRYCWVQGYPCFGTFSGERDGFIVQ